MTIDYYKQLGVPSSADDKSIRSAFRQLALKKHPDRGGDPEEFKRISEAYEVLKDPIRRAQYDRSSGHGRNVVFSQKMHHRRNLDTRKCKPVVFKLKVELENLYVGTIRKLRITRVVIGKETTPSIPVEGSWTRYSCLCTTCHGTGVVVQTRILSPGFRQQIHGSCPVCKGACAILRKGFVASKQTEVVSVNVAKGMANGNTIVIEGQGDMRPGFNAGDVICVLVVAEHKVFERRGDNLHTTLDVSLFDSLCGARVRFNHLDGRTIELRAPDNMIVTPDEYYLANDLGMPIRDTCEHGSLLIKFRMSFPKKTLTRTQKVALRTLFSDSNSNSTSQTANSDESDDDNDDNNDIETHYLSTGVSTPPPTRASSKSALDSDEDCTNYNKGYAAAHHPGRPGCAQM